VVGVLPSRVSVLYDARPRLRLRARGPSCCVLALRRINSVHVGSGSARARVPPAFWRLRRLAELLRLLHSSHPRGPGKSQTQTRTGDALHVALAVSSVPAFEARTLLRLLWSRFFLTRNDLWQIRFEPMTSVLRCGLAGFYPAKPIGAALELLNEREVRPTNGQLKSEQLLTDQKARQPERR
jgi:hypothetical protein